jgi:hypothetical protein
MLLNALSEVEGSEVEARAVPARATNYGSTSEIRLKVIN